MATIRGPTQRWWATTTLEQQLRQFCQCCLFWFCCHCYSYFHVPSHGYLWKVSKTFLTHPSPESPCRWLSDHFPWQAPSPITKSEYFYKISKMKKKNIFLLIVFRFVVLCFVPISWYLFDFWISSDDDLSHRKFCLTNFYCFYICCFYLPLKLIASAPHTVVLTCFVLFSVLWWISLSAIYSSESFCPVPFPLHHCFLHLFSWSLFKTFCASYSSISSHILLTYKIFLH